MHVAEPHLDHERAHALFGLFVDQELAEPDERALRGHLDACKECKSDFERYNHTVSLVRSVERERAPRELAAQVMRRIRRRRRHGIFGVQGARFFEHVSIPVEAAVPVILVAAAVAVLFLMLR